MFYVYVHSFYNFYQIFDFMGVLESQNNIEKNLKLDENCGKGQCKRKPLIM